MSKKKEEKAVVTGPMYEIIRRPVITEKSMQGANFSQVTFEVPLEATKPQIKEAVEAVFKVKVKAVNTLRSKGKVKNFHGRPGVRSDRKKAVVTLEAGHNIDVTTGV